MKNHKKLLPKLSLLAASLPSTVPFVAPEMTERATGKMFIARLGANESSFGPSPKV
jgi:histidinol-phosphate aminotransferase